MAALKVFMSNRLEILGDKLADILKEPLQSPMEAEVIVVQSRGMERWISMQLAHRHGICANYRFPFPNHFVQELFGTLGPHLSEPSPFEPKALTWRVMGLLPVFLEQPQFESLRHYLGSDKEHLKRLQLAERIADLFDQYLIFRPEMIAAWEKGEGDHWQALLWRELVTVCGKHHRAALAQQFRRVARDAIPPVKGMPERVCVFGISALPPFYLEILKSISHLTRIFFFLMNPCREYWGDIVTDWEIREAMEKGDPTSLENLHFHKGNTLLGSMGALGKSFFDLLSELECEEISLFEEPKYGGLLTTIQSDILNLTGKEEKRFISSDDQTIHIHSCHSPMREMEVLYDQLLNIFTNHPQLEPRDIVVMTPDIESYAPYIHAVFDTPRPPNEQIPFRIADRSARQESRIIESFSKILELPTSRFAASEVMAILECPAVQHRFGFHEPDLEVVEQWIAKSGIRWGIDAHSKANQGLPAISDNTWRAGLERLLLGYAMPGRDEIRYEGILPVDAAEGESALALGNFCDFAEQLFEVSAELNHPRSLGQWANTLSRLLQTFFEISEEWEQDLNALHRMIFSMKDMAGTADFLEPVDLNVVRWHLEESSQREGFGFGFITGSVTFCALLPMRSIPFQVICLLGMNHDTYPRQTKSLGFDLMQKHPRKGDRSRREDDRYLFLESLLSARAQLYISYVGQSIQDNSPIPPSVLVSELVDYVEQNFEVVGGSVREHLITRHRLQPFSPEYFKGNEGLFSYSQDNLETAQCLMSHRQQPPPFVAKWLHAPDEEWRQVDLENLCSFFSNPSKYLLSKRLGIYFREGRRILQDTEPFQISGLERYLLEQDLATRALSGEDLEDSLALFRASGQLPHGTPGACIFGELSNGAKIFARKTLPFLEGKVREPVEGSLSLGRFTLTGTLKDLYMHRLIQYRYARLTATDRIRMWITHLFLNGLAPVGYPTSSALIGLDPKNRREAVWLALEFQPVENATGILEQLLNRYWEGLRTPLPFFPRSSWEFALLVLQKGKEPGYALSRALGIWRGNEYSRGEVEDPYLQQCFRNITPLDESFQELALEIFGALMEHEKRLEA